MIEEKPKTRSYGYVGSDDKTIPTNQKLGKFITYLFLLVKKSWHLASNFLSYLSNKIPFMSREKRGQFRKKLGLYFILFLVFGFLFLTIFTAWASRDLPDPDKLTDRQIAESTKIYDRTGTHLLYEVFANQKRTLVELDQIPKNLVNGVIATEDTKFYEHMGIRPLSILRAFVYGAFTSRRISGTSTLTQQLVKNAILTNERTITRKLREIILSIRLEQKYSKDQILKIYFNEIPYGSTNYGVQAAAQSYFGKSVTDLTLEQCATLAGLPQAPSTYLTNPVALKNRRDFVLERMVAEGYITRAEADTAQATPLSFEKKYGNMQAPHFVLYVKQKLVEKYGEQTVDTGGLKVITTLDWEKQQAAEKAIENASTTLREGQADNASLVAMDPKNGQILALVGSLDFSSKTINGQFNVATQGKRQPGSSFKPIIYAAAFEKGYTPDTILFDVNTNFSVTGAPYEPRNYDLGERGPVTIRQALQGSLNIPAVQALYLVGQKNGVEFAGKMGYTTLSEGVFGLSLVLGGGEVVLLEHTNAYAAFANGGTHFEPVSILRVEDKKGETLEEWKRKTGEKILDEKITATISNVLSDDASRAYVFGVGGVLTLKDRPVAAKTGTTNNYRDAWTMGYTPSLVAGVWVGNTDNREMRKGDGGSKLAAPIWNNFMSEALKNTPVESFPELPVNDADKPILRGSNGGGVVVRVDKFTGKLATSSTPPEYVVDKTYMPAHSILHYVNKDDPRGPTPENPSSDPQYQIWEDAIQDWITRKKEKEPNWYVDFSEPPTEYDDENSIVLIPTLTILYPTSSTIFSGTDLNTDIGASAPRGITKVTYKIDDKYVGVVREHPFNLNYSLNEFSNGSHLLTVTAEDDIGNQVTATTSFMIVK